MRILRYDGEAAVISVAKTGWDVACRTIIWVAVKELKLSYHNGYIYIYSKY